MQVRPHVYQLCGPLRNSRVRTTGIFRTPSCNTLVSLNSLHKYVRIARAHTTTYLVCRVHHTNPPNFMAKKVKCHCGCRSLVSASTERRHRAGKATPRVKASHAARHTIYAPKHLPPTTKKRSTACLHSEHLSAPEIFSQPPDNANMHLPDDIANRHPDGGTLHVPTSEGAQGTEPVDYDNWDGGQVSEALANVREEAWR